MAISNTDYKINTEKRDSLKVDMAKKTNSFQASVGRNTSYDSSSLIGITGDMVSRVETAFDSYIDDINQALSQIVNQPVDVAFKGSSIERAFENLVAAIKNTSMDFTSKLGDAEKQIIRSVREGFANQDITVGQQMESHTSNLS